MAAYLQFRIAIMKTNINFAFSANVNIGKNINIAIEKYT